ncbi:unnamed protein product [Parnassius apollo]|uniref:(apollo) hypothetical protein n=1 Tax=Parnassius apollo TaxID=110799 RepID=A0A8S3Y191_PARAO|nr:unnamed protein product [Parnassius apollo]
MYPVKDIRPRKAISQAAFKKDNYWMNQMDVATSSWYEWDTKIVNNYKEKPAQVLTNYEPFSKDLRDYLQTSTLHGLRYVGDKKLTWFESKDLNDLNLTFPSPSVDWTPEGGYPSDAPPNGFPWKPKGNKVK